MSDERQTHPTAAHAQRVVRALETLLEDVADGHRGRHDVVGRVEWLLLQRDEIRREVAALYRYALEGKRQAAEEAYMRLAALLGITSDVKRDGT